MKVRLAEGADAKAIAQVHVASWQSAYRGILPDKLLDNLSVENRAKNWQAWLAQSRGQTLVLEVGGQVVGFVMCGPTRDRDVDGKKVGEIYAIYLHPDVWGHGFGRRLVEKVKALFRQEGYSELLLWVLADNEAAIQFYEKVGFEADGATKVEIETDGTQLHECRYRQPVAAVA